SYPDELVVERWWRRSGSRVSARGRGCGGVDLRLVLRASRARPIGGRAGVPRAPLPVCGAGDPFFRTLGAMIPLLRLTHIGICVSDMERSLRFYRDLLGFRFEHELRVAGEPGDTLLRLRGVELHAVYLQRDGVRIELLHFAAPPGPPPRSRPMNERGLTHLSFRVSDLDATLAGL